MASSSLEAFSTGRAATMDAPSPRATGSPENQFRPPEPDLHLKPLSASISDARSTRGPLGIAVSVLAHALLVSSAITLPLLVETPLPEIEGGGVRAFFATPLELAPPPPPPPPAAVKALPKVETPKVARADGLLAPVETPAEIVPELGVALGIEGGVADGVEGGIPGGVVGGVIGGLPEAPPPPAPRPLRVGGQVREPTKLRDVPPVYPETAIEARIEGVVVLECLISPQGRVSEVKVLRGVPLLDEAAVEAVRQWVYTPTLMDGVPMPVLMTVTVRFALTGPR